MAKTIEEFLNRYLESTRPPFSRLEMEAGHQIANVFLTFKHGLYEDSVQRARRALEILHTIGGWNDLEKALAIIIVRARDLCERGAITTLLPVFTPEETSRLAVHLSADEVDDLSHLQFTNAILLLYIAALSSSPRDIQALEEQRNFLLLMLGPYKEKILK
ncbi:MAG: hypothetical protein LUQ13_03770 [Methanomicrobiales archaeon]|nr:hypothetical protein [Methanomicrobiales archaeon]